MYMYLLAFINYWPATCWITNKLCKWNGIIL